MENLKDTLVDQFNPVVNAPQWAATITGLIGTALGLATDDPWIAIIGAAVGAVLGWIVQKVFAEPKGAALTDAEQAHMQLEVGTPDTSGDDVDLDDVDLVDDPNPVYWDDDGNA